MSGAMTISASTAYYTAANDSDAWEGRRPDAQGPRRRVSGRHTAGAPSPSLASIQIWGARCIEE